MVRVLYAGSPDASAKTFSLLAQNATDYEIVGVLTNPASAQGRHKTPVPTAVATAAGERGIPVFTPEHLDAACREQIAAISPDILVCFAYGHIFGPKFLALFKCGGINLHPSLLPKYRGATPVNAAILNGDAQTGITVQRLALAMDEGDILVQEIVALHGMETAGSLLDYCALRGAELIKNVLVHCAKYGVLPNGTAQQGEASYTKVIAKDDCRIDWGKSAKKIEAHVRAYSPVPSAWTLADGEQLKILEAHVALGDVEHGADGENFACEAGTTYGRKDAAWENGSAGKNLAAPSGTVLSFHKKHGIFVKTGDGMLAVTKLQKQGKKAMDAAAFMNGARNFVGMQLH